MSDTRIAWLNGAFLPLAEASVPVMDRGFLFADGVYEVTAVLDGRLIESAAHLDRLRRSAAALEIALPLSLDEIEAIERALITRNGMVEGGLYLQLTRGVGERDFLARPERPTLLMFTQARPVIANPAAETGVAVVTMPDLRWARRDIKSLMLLAQVMAKRAAATAGAQEAWLVEDGFVTEGASSTALIVTDEGVLVARPNGETILPGCTRIGALAAARATGITIEERPFTVAETLASREAMLASASNLILPVVRIDGQPVGDGRPGPIARELRRLYIAAARAA